MLLAKQLNSAKKLYRLLSGLMQVLYVKLLYNGRPVQLFPYAKSVTFAINNLRSIRNIIWQIYRHCRSWHYNFCSN